VPAPEVINEALVECLPLAWNIGVEERITAAYGSDVTNEVKGLYELFLVRLALLGSLSQFLHTGSSTPTWPPRSRGGGCRARAPDRPTRAWLRRMLGGTHHSPARS
jgi:hypothetical protein